MAQASDCSYRDRIHAAGYLGVVIGGKRGSPCKSVIRLSWPSVSEAQYPTHCD
ncbi:hypothetical protein BDFG_01960 [Blastomyces dermatitidis ATCC 26199]|nr:hypothetical protein BDFG_01960 [Blastomyces dermatitidis ATCC 26199]